MPNTRRLASLTAAKASGKKEFTFNGKKYHTRTKDEEKAATTPVKVKAKKKLAPVKVTAKKKLAPAKVTAKRKKANPTMAKGPGGAYSRMAKSGGVPGKAGTSKPKPKAKPKAKAKAKADAKTGASKKYGRNRNATILNTPKNRGGGRPGGGRRRV